MKQFFCVLVLVFTQHALLHSQKPNKVATSGKVIVQFEHYAGGKPLLLDSLFTNAHGENYTVTKFRYYISRICLVKKEAPHREILIDTTLLIDEQFDESKHILLAVPTGEYDQISFTLGVDSIKNVSGAQAGALDPQLDMFWTWRSGYIMAKLEGNSPVSKLPRRMIEYHIGGFAGIHKAIQPVRLTVPPGKSIPVNSVSPAHLVISADVNAWFSGVHDLPIATNPACTFIGQQARRYSENYQKMFTLRAIER